MYRHHPQTRMVDRRGRLQTVHRQARPPPDPREAEEGILLSGESEGTPWIGARLERTERRVWSS